MYVTSVPVIDQLIAERRVHTGFPRDQLGTRIYELEERLETFEMIYGEDRDSDHVCCCCGTCIYGSSS